MIRWRVALAAGLALWPGASLAHGMGNAVGYLLTVESMLESVNSPIVLLLLFGLAILAGTSGMERARRAAGYFAVGLVAGIPASTYLGPYGAVTGLMVGGICSLTSAARPASLPEGVLPVLALAGGLASSIYNLEGHVVADLPFAAHLGVILGPLVLGLSMMSWIAILLEPNRQAWVGIMFRIVSSWSFAANAIYLAFQVKSGG